MGRSRVEVRSAPLLWMAERSPGDRAAMQAGGRAARGRPAAVAGVGTTPPTDSLKEPLCSCISCSGMPVWLDITR